MANAQEAESREVKKEPLKLPTRSKSLADLVNSLKHCDDEDEVIRDAILVSVGLSDGLDQQVPLSLFRHVISKYFNVDASYLYKRVFNAFDRTRKGYLSGNEFVSAIYILIKGPFQAHVDLGLRVYGKPIPVNPVTNPDLDKKSAGVAIPTTEYFITRVDAITSIVESLQLSSPRARYTLTTDNREKAYHIGEDLVFIIFPKLDIDGDDLISLDDFTKACLEDPSLVQVFGQFLPKNIDVSPPVITPVVVEEKIAEELPPLQRPRSSISLNSFENIDYLKHSPTMGKLWGQADRADHKSKSVDDLKQSNKLQQIPVLQRNDS